MKTMVTQIAFYISHRFIGKTTHATVGKTQREIGHVGLTDAPDDVRAWKRNVAIAQRPEVSPATMSLTFVVYKFPRKKQQQNEDTINVTYTRLHLPF